MCWWGFRPRRLRCSSSIVWRPCDEPDARAACRGGGALAGSCPLPGTGSAPRITRGCSARACWGRCAGRDARRRSAPPVASVFRPPRRTPLRSRHSRPLAPGAQLKVGASSASAESGAGGGCDRERGRRHGAARASHSRCRSVRAVHAMGTPMPRRAQTASHSMLSWRWKVDRVVEKDIYPAARATISPRASMFFFAVPVDLLPSA